ncbi:MAG: hypothetical protein P8188_12300 [Gemmatimonadota bacterium]
MEERVPARLTASEGRRFAFPVGGVFAAIAGVFWWRDHLLTAQILGALGGSLILAGLLIPRRLGPVYRGWMALAMLISKVTTPIFMAIVYFLVITPAGLIRRTVSRSAIVHREEQGSYWKRREEGSRRGNLQRQF